MVPYIKRSGRQLLLHQRCQDIDPVLFCHLREVAQILPGDSLYNGVNILGPHQCQTAALDSSTGKAPALGSVYNLTEGINPTLFIDLESGKSKELHILCRAKKADPNGSSKWNIHLKSIMKEMICLEITIP